MPVLYPVFLETPYDERWLNLTDSITNCTGGVPWILRVLGECVLTDRQYASVITGLISLLIWMTVGFPQMYKNCRDPKALEGFSFPFVVQWLLGDSTNLIGCILTKQLPVQTYTAVYYVSADLVLIAQIIYFRIKKKDSFKKSVYSRSEVVDEVPRVVCCISGILTLSALFTLSGRSPSFVVQPSIYNTQFTGSRTLLSLSPHLEHVNIFRGTLDITGYVIGVVSASFYVGSRTAQIYKNWSRKSTEGVSLFLFLLAVFGNLFYGLSVFLQSTDEIFIIRHLPWIIGSLGIMMFDMSILGQHFYYKHKNRLTSELGGTEPLLYNEPINC